MMKTIRHLLVIVLCGAMARAVVATDAPQEMLPCGVSSLKTAAALLNVKASVQQVRELVGAKCDDFSTLADLTHAAEKLGLHAAGLEMSTAELKDLHHVAIAHVELIPGKPHFVVIADVHGDQLLLVNYTTVVWVPIAEFEKNWTHRVLVLDTQPIAVQQTRGFVAAASFPPSSALPKALPVEYGLQAVVNPIILNAGKAKSASESLECEFELRNVSNQPVEITEARACCASSAKLLTPGPIATGGVARIAFTTPRASGSARRSVAAYARGASSGWIILTAAIGEQVTWCQSTEEQMQFGPVPAGTDGVAELHLFVDRGTTLSGISCPLNNLTLTTQVDNSPSLMTPVLLTGRLSTEQAKRGLCMEWITIRGVGILSGEPPEMTIHVLAEIVNPVRCDRARLFWGSVQCGKSETLDVSLEALDGQAFHVTSVQAPFEGVEVSGASPSAAAAKKCALRVKWTPSASGLKFGNIIINTDHAHQPPLVLPAYGIGVGAKS
jgi:hypothetical protein